jgi:hypothetical protein
VTVSGIRLGAGFAMTLTLDDACAVAEECTAVAAAAPAVRGGVQVVYGNNNWATSIQGTTPEYLAIRELGLTAGDAFTAQDVDGAAKVALLGKTVADNLFESEDPVGKVIRIRKVPFTVIGVIEPKGQSPTGQDQDDLIIIPISTAKKKVLGGAQASANAVGNIMIQARDPQLMKEAETQVQELLRQRHHLASDQDDDFTVRNLEELFTAQEASADVMSILLASIASVSLPCAISGPRWRATSPLYSRKTNVTKALCCRASQACSNRSEISLIETSVREVVKSDVVPLIPRELGWIRKRVHNRALLAALRMISEKTNSSSGRKVWNVLDPAHNPINMQSKYQTQ